MGLFCLCIAVQVDVSESRINEDSHAIKCLLINLKSRLTKSCMLLGDLSYEPKFVCSVLQHLGLLQRASTQRHPEVQELAEPGLID